MVRLETEELEVIERVASLLETAKHDDSAGHCPPSLVAEQCVGREGTAGGGGEAVIMEVLTRAGTQRSATLAAGALLEASLGEVASRRQTSTPSD